MKPRKTAFLQRMILNFWLLPNKMQNNSNSKHNRRTNLQKGFCVINTILPTTPKRRKKKHFFSQWSNQNKPILHHIVHITPRSKQQCIRSKKAVTPQIFNGFSKGPKFKNPLKKWRKPRKQNLILININDKTWHKQERSEKKKKNNNTNDKDSTKLEINEQDKQSLW